MAPHPLCNKFPLQSATMAVAILNIVGSRSIMLLGFVVLYIGMQVDLSQEGSDKETAKTFLIVFLIVLMLSGGISGLRIVSCIVLYQGAKTKNKLKCQIWLIIAITGAFMTISKIQRDTFSLPATLIGFIFKVYSLWIVGLFIQEIKMEPGIGEICILDNLKKKR